MYLPWLGFFDRINKCDCFILLDDVQYSKNYFLNRNKIKAAGGSSWITVPVLTKGNFEQKIKDVRINNSTNWAKKHWMSIYYSYKKAKCFTEFSAFLEEAYSKEWGKLSEISEYFISAILNLLEIKTPIKRSSQLKVVGKKEELILNLCRSMGATEYLSGPDGRNYLDTSLWEKNGIKVIFHDYIHPKYSQLHGSFLPRMSIIDLLLNCGKESLNILNDRSSILK